jgi:hypothetical protein
MEVRLRLKCFGIDLANTFPGVCAEAADAVEFTSCVRRKALCRTCIMINTADEILGYCDVFDDGVANATCVDPKRCGNGVVEPGEACDDGNNEDGDCCAADCAAEENGLVCDDGLFCTATDACLDGACVGSGDPCVAGGECAYTCNEEADTCLEVAGTPCTSDENSCTDDRCDGLGACIHPPNAAPCDDGQFCNGTDTCAAGACSVHAGNPCAGGPECADLCDEEGETCNEEPGTPCLGDGNPCTDDVCDGEGACTHPNNTDSCDDGLYCTVTDTCIGGTCQGSGNPCAGGPECADTCDELTDGCNDPAANPCTDDGNPCTDDICDGSGSCLHPFNAAPCDDGNACTVNDVCFGGTCVGGGPRDCDDGNVCTDDSCNPESGCLHDANTAVCDDGNACTVGDVCAAGSCIGGAPPDCDDGNLCTDDTCNPAVGCENTNNTVACDDGLFCTGSDACSGGVCVGGPSPCTGGGECADLCDEDADTCNDPAGSPCTSDGNVCTDNECNGAGQCAAVNNTDPCPGDGHCGGGICIPPDCEDSIRNAAETDVDCGGDTCDPCTAGQTCLVASDCDSSVCTGGICQPALCTDGVLNGDESDIDCGGSCDGCLLGEFCGAGTDCASSTCTAGACTCGNQNLTLTINSSVGGAFTAAAWPGGTETIETSPGCSVTFVRPEGRVDAAGSGSVFAIESFAGFSACAPGACEMVFCPPVGIPQCFGDRPNCSAALNGSAQARWINVNCSN